MCGLQRIWERSLFSLLLCVMSHAANQSTFQLTIGAPGDFPGASGMAYRYIDNNPAGGWVFGGWAQGGSGIARVAANGTVIWSHKMNYVVDGRKNSQTGLQVRVLQSPPMLQRIVTSLVLWPVRVRKR
jgi:hypothetical protein